MRAIPLVVLLISAPTAAQKAPTLWGNVQYGMTQAQVRAAQPSAAVPATISTLRSGAACSLAIPHYEVAAKDYGVCFFFRNGKLEQVTLNAAGEPYESQFQSIVTALRARYGKELGIEKTALGYSAEWLTAEGVNVNVTFLDKYGKLLNINYQLRLASDASKL